jgi:hypothetical protein
VYADITAYIFQVNKFPAGKDALGSDEPRMARTIIEKEKKESRAPGARSSGGWLRSVPLRSFVLRGRLPSRHR